MIYHFDIKTVSEANQREHWTVKRRRKIQQQTACRYLWRYQRGTVTLPAVVTFKRFSCKELDTDNLAGAFKHVQDALAKEIGIDDGSPLIEWRYTQERIPRRKHWFTVRIDPKI